MKQKSYWIRVYEIVFTSLIMSSIIYLVTSIPKDIGYTILGESIIIPLVLFYGFQGDYYLNKIGDLKKLGNKLIALISLSMICLSYGMMFELPEYLNKLEEYPKTSTEVAYVISHYVLNESYWLFGGLLVLSMVFFFAINYYDLEIKSHFKHSKYAGLVNKLKIVYFLYTVALIYSYLMRIFYTENNFYYLIGSCIILGIIYAISCFFIKREKIPSWYYVGPDN